MDLLLAGGSGVPQESSGVDPPTVFGDSDDTLGGIGPVGNEFIDSHEL